MIESGLLLASGAFANTDNVKPVAVAVLGTGAGTGVVLFVMPVEDESLQADKEIASAIPKASGRNALGRAMVVAHVSEEIRKPMEGMHH